MRTDLAIPDELVNLMTGEVVPTNRPGRVADLLRELREWRYAFMETIHAAEAVLIAESERQGTKTLRFGSTEVRITGGPETTYDVSILNELLAAGLPEERFGQLVRTTVEIKPIASVAKQLAAANPRYAEIIERARIVRDTPMRVSVKE